MKEKIRNHIEGLFADAPKTRKAMELKEELIANLFERFDDLASSGKDEETALQMVIAGIGNTDDLLIPLRQSSDFDAAYRQEERKKSALRVSIAVMMYIISVLFPMIFDRVTDDNIIGIVLMLIMWAFATGILIYNFMSRPSYSKKEDTVVEEFKEWSQSKSKTSEMEKAIISIVWTLCVIVYLLLGFFFFAWHPGWLIFIIGAAVTQIIKLFFVTNRSGD